MVVRRPIKIIHLIGSMSLGGAQKLTKLIVEGLDHKEFTSIVYCVHGGGHYAGTLAKQGFIVRVMAQGRIAGLVHMLLTLPRLLREECPDVLHTHLFWVGVLGRLIGRLCRIPVLVTSFHRLEYSFQPVVERALLRITDKIVVDSFATRNLFVGQGVPDSKFQVIYNGIDRAEFEGIPERERIRTEIHVPANQPLVGIVAHLSPVKGHVYLLQAFSQICSQFDAHLLCVGDGKLLPSLKQLTDKLNINDRVTFLSSRSDLRDILSALDVFVLPSIWEGFGIVLAEAMYMGVPVITTNVSGTSEVVSSESGILVRYGDVPGLAAALTSILSDGNVARRYSQNGHKRVELRFTKERMASEYATLYRQLCYEKLR